MRERDVIIACDITSISRSVVQALSLPVLQLLRRPLQLLQLLKIHKKNELQPPYDYKYNKNILSDHLLYMIDQYEIDKDYY